MRSAAFGSMLRSRDSDQRVTNIELFFDLVYVFAVTQLSHGLLNHLTVEGALQTALLLGMVWLVWAYTTWVTNWLDPDRNPTRLMLIALMLASLVMSTGLPEAFGDRGLAVGGAYAAMQIGRSVYTVFALRGERLQRNFERILAWCMVSGALALAGGFADGRWREALWLAAILVDFVGGWVGFYTPGLGRSVTQDWTIEGGHFAERCQAFMLIALGESIVVTGATFADHSGDGAATVAAFVVAFGGGVALWWIYFDRSADDAARVIAESEDPGRLGRSAYTLVHPVMIAGIIVLAAGDEEVVLHPTDVADVPVRWLILGGTALFVAGHALFKAIVWRVVPWTRIAVVVVLGLLALLAPHVSALTLAGCALLLLIALAVGDRIHSRTIFEVGRDELVPTADGPKGAQS
jgi:low temperature requirement protein LtrA